MNSYLQGFVSGGVFVFAFIVFLGSKEPKKQFSKSYRVKLVEIENRVSFVEGVLEEKFKLIGENFLYLKSTVGILTDTEYNYNSVGLIEDPFILERQFNGN